MSHSEHLVLTVSLALNGFWIGGWLISRMQDSSRRLGIVTLALFVTSLLLLSLAFFLPHGSIVTLVSQSASSVLSAASVWCFTEWAKLQPAPWGMGPRREKARVR